MSKFEYADHINDYLDAIKGKDEFIVKHDSVGGYKIINYLVNFETTFQSVDIADPDERRKRILLRDCRGIAFDDVTGKVISKPFHKFFNVNEREETRVENLDLSKPHRILTKLDGSFIRPLVSRSDEVRYATKMGLTDIAVPVSMFAKNGISYQDGVKVRSFYNDFCYDLNKSNYTPIFEWTSRLQRIVIDYPIDALTLLAVRHNFTGEYVWFDDLPALADPYGIPIVKSLPGTMESFEQLLEHTRGLVNEEGYVLAFKDGSRYKIKAEEYCRLHKAIDKCRLEKDILYMVLSEKSDDVAPFLQPDLREKLEKYSGEVNQGMKKLADELYWVAQAAYDNLNGSKKRFALEVIPNHKQVSGILFKIFDNLDKGPEYAFEVIRNEMKGSTSTSTKVNQNRHLIGGATWYDLPQLDDN